jgi:exodeoxyribonuclease-1
MQTYLFYDIETSGLNKAFDQVLQFAAIRTDTNLQELERYEIKVQLNPDTVPSPQALLTHHIGVAEASQGVTEYDAMRQIHELLNTPGTISIGYNTLGFDDEFLRFSFYRNLLPPYTHQYANRCARADLYPVTIMYHLFKKDILQWPQINGETKLKLELINSTNKFVDGRAHDAMVDVEITLKLAQRFFQAREMWDFLLNYFAKDTDQLRAEELPVALESSYGQHSEGLMVLGKIGATNYFQAPVLHLGNHAVYKQTEWLRLDTVNLATTTPQTIAENTWVIHKKWGGHGFLLPPKERFLNYLSSERKAQAETNKLWLQQNPDLFKQIITHHRQAVFPVLPDTDQDATLYHNGFWSNDEMALCRRFHQVTNKDKAALAATIQNPRLKSIATRLLGRNFPESMNSDQQQEFATYLQRVKSSSTIIDFKGDTRLNAQTALAEIATLIERPELDQTQLKLLTDLKLYLQKNFFSD